MIDIYQRYQKGLSVGDLFPSIKGMCACGCGNTLEGRKKKWSSGECRDKSLIQFQIIKGDATVIRELLFEEEQGFCRMCGAFDERWEADHIIPVMEGGGACGFDNFQTLCPSCHKEKSRGFFNRTPYSHE